MTRATLRAGIIASAICLLAVSADAQGPAPQNGKCGDCKKLQQTLAQKNEAVDDAIDRRSGFRRQLSEQAEELAKAEKARAEFVELLVAAGRAFISDAAKQRVEELNRSISRLESTIDSLEDDISAETKTITKLDGEIDTLRDALNKCQAGCGNARTTGTLGPGGMQPGGTCADCPGLPERIQKVEAELEQLSDTINNIQENQKTLEDAKARAGGDQQRIQSLDGQLTQLNQAHGRAVAEEKAKTTELEGLQKKRDDCRSCPKQTGFRLTDPRIIGGLGGGAVLVALLAGGDETPTVTAGTPVAPQQPPVASVNPTPVPAPAPTPVPDPIDQRMGVYLFQSCLCESDPAGHDSLIHLCQSVQQFRLTRTGANTARIDSTAPLFTSDFIIDANSQTVDANAVGMVGSSSASLQYSGTFAPAGSPNLLLSLAYGISNSTTRYRVTAVRQ